MRTRERAHEATNVFVVVSVVVILVGTSTSLDDDRGDVDAETTREDDRDRARAFGARGGVGAIVANGMTTSEERVIVCGRARRDDPDTRRPALGVPMASVEDGDDDARAREDECEALRAIYGDENVSFARVRDGREDDTVVELALGDGAWRASATLPVGYPSARADGCVRARGSRARGARARGGGVGELSHGEGVGGEFEGTVRVRVGGGGDGARGGGGEGRWGGGGRW